MRKSILILPVMLAAAACSQKQEAADQPVTTETKTVDIEQAATADSAAEGEAAAPPKVSANVAPGVAFEYRYNFALPEAKISNIQTRHAALCEQLGIVHCRVTGMNYKRGDDGVVDATLAFKLDPAMASGFARDATDLVEKADGRLADSEISGNDVGTAIVATDKSLAGIDAELAKIDAQLKIPNLSKDVRGRLVEQAQSLREERRSLRGDRDDKVESLATTPVQFNYGSSEGVLGMDERSPFNRAARTSANSMMVMLEFVLTMAGGLLPWALLGGGIWWIVRKLRTRRVVAE